MSKVVSSIPHRKPSYSGCICKMSNEHGRPVRLKAFGLNPKVMVKYPWSEAPHELKEVCCFYPGTPDYVVIVPNSMRFDDLPQDAYEIHELADGYICFL